MTTACGGRHACIALLVVASIACDPADRWGGPEYFERVVGVRFVPAAAPVRCQAETGFDYVAFRQVSVPRSVVEGLRGQTRNLAAFPRQLPYERERRLQTWTQGPFSAEARELFELAMAGAAAAIQESGCRGVDSDEISSRVSASLRKSTTFYTFQYKQVDGRVAAEALDFRVLDLDDGVLFELVNFS